MQSDNFLGASLRLPPTNLPAEQALLGAVFTSRRALDSVADFLRSAHFAEAVHGRIYAEAARRILAGGVANPLTLQIWFDADPDAERLGGIGYLTQLQVANVGVLGAREYGLAIFDAWRRRELIEIAGTLHCEAFAASDGDIERSVAATIDRLDAVVAGADDERATVTFDIAMSQSVAALERACRTKGPTGLSTGLRSLDETLGGLEPHTVTILAGRPGMGKSALALQMAIAVARAEREESARGGPKRAVLVISLEMSALQLGRRALAAAAGVTVEALRKGHVTQDEVDRIVKAQIELAGLPLLIEEGSGLTMNLIRLKARSTKRRQGLSLIVLDHLHIVQPEQADARNDATYAVGRVSNFLKRLAKEFNVPVLALAQLNRAVESREDKQPSLADLKQSGDIEQDADGVIFVHRPEYFSPRSEPDRHQGETQQAHAARVGALADARRDLAGKATLIIAKLRDGSPGTVTLRFDAATASFHEL